MTVHEHFQRRWDEDQRMEIFVTCSWSSKKGMKLSRPFAVMLSFERRTINDGQKMLEIHTCTQILIFTDAQSERASRTFV